MAGSSAIMSRGVTEPIPLPTICRRGERSAAAGMAAVSPELAAHLGLDKSTISGLIDRAERRGFLARARNAEDGRAVDVFLTPAGHEMTARIYDEVRRELHPMMDALSGEQREKLHDLLRLTLRG